MQSSAAFTTKVYVTIPHHTVLCIKPATVSVIAIVQSPLPAIPAVTSEVTTRTFTVTTTSTTAEHTALTDNVTPVDTPHTPFLLAPVGAGH